MKQDLTDFITDEKELRDILGYPGEMNIKKVIPLLDKHCRTFIAHSPFLLIASSDKDGNMDVSPKGDPAGFVQILDDKTLAIPDRSGNSRADTLTNILQNNQIALLFMIPGKRETLRVSGTAQIARDQWLLDQMAIKGKAPHLAIVVKVETAFIHCAKCIIRSNMWSEEQREDLSGLPSLSRMLIDHANLSYQEDEFQTAIDEEYQELIDERSDE